MQVSSKLDEVTTCPTCYLELPLQGLHCISRWCCLLQTSRNQVWREHCKKEAKHQTPPSRYSITNPQHSMSCLPSLLLQSSWACLASFLLMLMLIKYLMCSGAAL